jgi:hypothetical protein
LFDIAELLTTITIPQGLACLYGIKQGRIVVQNQSQTGKQRWERSLVRSIQEKRNESLERTADGRLSKTITLPDQAFIDTMAKSLAGIVTFGRTAIP